MSIGASICMDGNCQHKSGDGAKLRLLTSKDAGSKGCSRAGSQTMPYWSCACVIHAATDRCD